MDYSFGQCLLMLDQGDIVTELAACHSYVRGDP